MAGHAEPTWWASLNHGGLLIAPSKLAEAFGAPVPALPSALGERLREAVMRTDLASGQTRAARRDEAQTLLLNVVLEQVCGFSSNNWTRGGDISTQWSRRAVTGEAVRPRRLWQGPSGATLPVFVDSESRLGIGRGRRSVSRVIEWLRAGPEKIALITNHRQFRLIYAGSDFDAWAEWDTALWFEEGHPGPQVDALRQLLSPASFIASEGQTPRLLRAIEESRKGQVELSAALGERVRQAVELLIQEHGHGLAQLDTGVSHRHIYIAATRMVMRMVVILFAEARELLPRSLPVYEDSYGLQGLRTSLERIASGTGKASLRQRRSAWPRVLGLYRLIYEGSHHVDLPVQRYGGQLFAPGSATSVEPIERALDVFETVDLERSPTDASVAEILGYLCRTTARILQGNSAQRMEVPVDFSSLSSEYIGILYEGLLDYELRRAPEGDPMVFLAIGDQPVLPLSRLEGMDDGALKKLLEKFAKSNKKPLAAESDGEDDEDEADEEEEADEEADELDIVEDEPDEVADEPTPEGETLSPEQLDEELVKRVNDWARRAVVAAGMVKKPKGKNAQAAIAFADQTAKAGAVLWVRVVLPGEWFLVLWGGTRKGSGTFYTRPQLAVPTVRRTLEPLTIENGHPRTPEALLSLKICDPAMGSGSFLAASLRYLTDLLWQSLLHHGWLVMQDDAIAMPAGDERRPDWFLECVKNFPLTTDDAELPIRARLKRVVVERCLYGVDLDPLAVELARLALWVETMDRDLPFEFLDHRLKVGNALVGCWFDRFEDYPVMAWNREGGDKNHTTFVHHFRTKKGDKPASDKWTDAIKGFRNGPIKRELVEWINQQGSLFGPPAALDPESVHNAALSTLRKMEALPVHEPDARASFYREHMARNPALNALREAFDTWCALWFWPPDRLEDAPGAKTLLGPSDAARAIVQRLRAEHRFFHWELEFPDVFAAAGSGFDAMLGNPPWDIQKPNSKEFFTNIDPLYRAYGKQEALQKQREYFANEPAREVEWVTYSARFKALANWTKHTARPFGDPEVSEESFSFGAASDDLHRRWRERRGRHRAYGDPAHPFQHQGSADINTYKLFLEQAHALLKVGGQLGFIVPSGVYTDKGSTGLRELFLHHCEWQWLFVFENRERIFDIHRSFKFGPLIVRKGGVTDAFKAAFMRHDVNDWEEAERIAVPYPRTQVERFSPRTAAILEIRDRRDLEVLEKIYANSVLLGDQGPDGWGIKYATEFHMTSDSKLFPPRPVWEAKGYQPDEYGRWIKFREKRPVQEHPAEVGWIHLADGTGVVHEDAIEDVALPLYQGVMIAAFDWAAKKWIHGTGAKAQWGATTFDEKRVGPQFLMSKADYASRIPLRRYKVPFRSIARSTDERTVIASVVADSPCGNSVGVLGSSNRDVWSLVGALCSFVADWAIRVRLGGTNLNWYVMQEVPVVDPRRLPAGYSDLVRSLAMGGVQFADAWLRQVDRSISWRQQWACTPSERLRCRVVLDAWVASLFGFDCEDLKWMLRDCDHAAGQISGARFDPKGFWRSERHLDPELRHSVLTMVAFRDLTNAGSAGNRSVMDWQLPATLCLADYGLGHDDRAKVPQPVASRLGDRFSPWQLEQSVEDSWAECQRHARNLLGAEGFAKLKESVETSSP